MIGDPDNMQNEGSENSDETGAKPLAFLGDFKGLKTMKGSPSIYAVLSERDGLAFTVAPKIVLGRILGISARVRIRKVEPWANLANAGSAFGFPEVYEVGPDRSGCEMFVALATVNVAPYELGKLIADKKVLEKVVDQIATRLEDAGAKLAVSRETVVEYLRNVFEDYLPSEKPVEKVITDFPICVGDEAIRARYDALRKALNPNGGDESEPE